MGAEIDRTELMRMAAEITTAFVSGNTVATSDIPEVLKSVHATLGALAAGAVTAEAPTPAVPIKKSITKDYLICLEDGKKLKMLKRHLRATYGMSPEDYRAKWGLPADYPMVAPGYAARRSEFAKQIGLGRGGRAKAA